MSFIVLDDASIDFPILHVNHRSLKKVFIATATGGKIMRDSHRAPVVKALSGISAHINPGDRIGLVGPNGAGKTTLLRLMGGIYEPTIGRVLTRGKAMTLLDLGLGLNADMTGRENIRLRGMYMGMRSREIDALASEIEAFTELGDYLDMPMRTYSSGMQLRVSFAVATCVKPDILLMDEWVLAGDAAFVARAQARMMSFVSTSNILVLASHSEAIIEEWCNKAMYLAAGQLKAFGPTAEVLAAYRFSRGGVQ